ncbi:Panacea domain-containing protein [Carnobacterium mobile]|uniref:Panacea domain-containing protein n=1 Tax=Carnobacterium mobile TaxID=2750 RepID=UPI000557054F|nr:type II toxin-antitoxin system antitoxin SocA domain-containing protein [Carnobacterium mobile]
MTKDNNYFFKSVDDLVTHLKTLNPDIGPLRLQKTLYFLYAFYGATYGSIKAGDGISEISSNTNYPTRLFEGNFEAWQYGPVFREVYFKNKAGNYDGVADKTETDYKTTKQQDVIKFVDGLVEDLDEMSDFALVDRTHQDEAWKNKFDQADPRKSSDIDNDELVAEYVKKIAETSSI